MELSSLIIEYLPQSVILNSLNGNILMVNKKACEMTGYSEKELLKLTIDEISPLTNIKDRRKRWQKIPVNETRQIEGTMLRKNGELFPIEVTYQAIEVDDEKQILATVQDITTRKKTEDSLIYFKTAVDSSINAVGMTTPDGKTIYQNNTCRELFGEIGSNPIDQYVDKKVGEEVFSTIMKGGKWEGEVKMYGKSKKMLDIYLRAYPIFNEEHKITGLVGIHDDITQQKREHDKLEMVQYGMDNAQMTILQANDDGFITYANQTACTNLGYTKNELLSMTILDIDPTFNRDRWKTHRQKTKEKNKLTFQTLHKRKDGTIFPVEVSINYFSRDGIDFSFSFTEDISERLEAEKAIKESEQRFRRIFEESQFGIILLGKDMKIKNANPALSRILGYNMEELSNLTFVDLTLPDRIEKDTKTVKDLWEGKIEKIELEKQYRCKNGDIIWGSSIISAIKNNNGEVVNLLGMLQNITERITAKKDLETQNEEYQALNEEYLAQNEELENTLEKIQKINLELKKAKAKAEESDTLKTAFLANMSHEIRTPMNGILGFSQLLKNPELSENQQTQYIDVICNSGTRMLKIINDIIDIAKIEAGQIELKKEDFDIELLIRDMASFFQHDADCKLIKLISEVDLPDSEKNVFSDKTKVAQVLSNLIKNAIKNTEKGEIIFGCKKQNNQILFYVSDTGPGIPEDHIDTIFERFTQILHTERQFEEGAGLGLPISKAYIEKLGGKIWVESKINKGTCFYFTIPYKKSTYKTKEITTLLDSEVKIDFNGQTILVAEDDDVNYRYIVEICKRKNLKLIRAVNGKEAVEIVNSNPDIRMVLMDIKMPVMDGYTANKAIKKNKLKIPVIAVTAYAQHADKRKVLAENFAGYITKPFSSEQILKMINNLL